jgi:hypothetical protein
LTRRNQGFSSEDWADEQDWLPGLEFAYGGEGDLFGSVVAEHRGICKAGWKFAPLLSDVESRKLLK